MTFLISFKTDSSPLGIHITMSAKSKNYLSFPIGFIEGSGLSSTSKLYRKILSLGVFLPMTFVLLYLIIRKFREEKRDVLMIAEVFEAITTCAHVGLRFQ